MNPDENLEEYTSFFRKHYIFWLDDESGPPAAKALKSAFKVTALFHASFARGLYSSLQVLDAIKSGCFPRFDLAFIDVRLTNSDQYFTKVTAVKDTTLIGDAPIYTDDKAEVNKIEEFSGPDKFGFDLARVKSQAKESGGLFVWAWAMRICSEAKYVIYSASDEAKAKMEFLRIAGILDICNKGDLFHITNPEEYIEETVDKWFKVYVSAFGDFHEGVTKVTYTPLLHNPREGEKLVENCMVTKDRGFVNPIYFGSQQRRTHHDNAFIIHDIASRDEGREWKLTYERYDEFIDRGGVYSRPYVIDTLVKLIGRKIERHEIDRNVTDLVLNLKDTSQTWVVQINGAGRRRWPGIPPHLLPLGGEYDLNSKTVTLKDKEEARGTYLFASFFLPWADALISSDGKRASDAISAIRSQFGQQLKNGCELVRLFCRYAPFNAFIEASAEKMRREDAANALKRYDEVGVGKVLSTETARALMGYLNSDPPYGEWTTIKGLVELTYESLMAHFDDWAHRHDDWNIEIKPERGDREWSSGKWYADVRWIKEDALDTILNNLTADKAFDRSKNFQGTPAVRISVVKATNPARILISVADNGVGCDVDALRASGSGGSDRGYDRLLSGEGARLLRAYGDLTVSSGGRVVHLGSGQGARASADGSPNEGTSVTLSILLG